jgi:glycosyltransferase involved in cell wall biosynthesis
MHVLILPSWYFPYGTKEIGGRMVHDFAKGLMDADVDARILFADFNIRGPFRKKINIDTEEEVPTWRMYHWFLPKMNSFLIKKWAQKYANAIQMYIEWESQPDLLHAQSYLAAIAAQEVHRRTNIPYIVTERASSFISGKIPARHTSFIKTCFDDAAAITVTSPGLKSFVQPYTNNPVDVISNFYDPSVFYPDPVIKKFSTFTWVSVGEPSHTKGLDILIRAFGKIKSQFQGVEMKLILVDRIEEKKELMELSKQLNVENDIEWKGLISHVVLAGVLRKSHALVSASRVEAFGKTMIEANACGIPIVATKTDGAKYILSSTDQGLLCELNDVDSLAHAMASLYTNYHQYNSQSIVDHVASKFKKDEVIKQWIDLYNTIGL